MKKLIIFILGIIVVFIFTIIPVSANSAVRKWSAPGVHGLYLVNDNPIDVKTENLTFDLGPSSYVTAEYTFYNSSDSNIEAELLFPIGKFMQENGSSYYTYEPTVLVNGTNLDVQIRLIPSSSNNILDSLYKLNDNYIESDYDNKKFYRVIFDKQDLYKITLADGLDMYKQDGFFRSDNFYFYSDADKNPEVIAYDNDGNEAQFRIEEASKYDAVKDYYIKKFGRSFYDYYSEIDLYNLYVNNSYNEEIYSVIDYKISIPAKDSIINRVKTNLYYGTDSSYSPSLGTIEYFLEPARTFNSFENLTITINTTDLFLITNNLGIEAVENSNQTYTVKYEKLPDFNIRLGLCNISNPTNNSSKYQGAGLVITVLIAAIAGAAIILTIGIFLFVSMLIPFIISIKRKLIKNVFMLFIENVFLAFAILLLSISIFASYNHFTIALIIIFGIALCVRLIGALIINKKIYNNKTWVFDSICMIIELCLIIICLVTYLTTIDVFYYYALPLSIILFVFNISYIFFRKKFYLNKEISDNIKEDNEE